MLRLCEHGLERRAFLLDFRQVASQLPALIQKVCELRLKRGDPIGRFDRALATSPPAVVSSFYGDSAGDWLGATR